MELLYSLLNVIVMDYFYSVFFKEKVNYKFMRIIVISIILNILTSTNYFSSFTSVIGNFIPFIYIMIFFEGEKLKKLSYGLVFIVYQEWLQRL